MAAEDSSVRPVLVTGFGPFHQHTVNASWAAVQELQKLGVQDASSRAVPLVMKEIPVVYAAVKETVPSLLRELQPQLCLHVGVSPYKMLVLEKSGRNSVYSEPDINGKSPEQGCCVLGGQEYLETAFDVLKVLGNVSQKQLDVQFGMSNDAGHFMCDYIYYTSLHVNTAPVLFVHVCEVDKPYSVQQLAVALKNIVEALLQEIATK